MPRDDVGRKRLGCPMGDLGYIRLVRTEFGSPASHPEFIWNLLCE